MSLNKEWTWKSSQPFSFALKRTVRGMGQSSNCVYILHGVLYTSPHEQFVSIDRQASRTSRRPRPLVRLFADKQKVCVVFIYRVAARAHYSCTHSLMHSSLTQRMRNPSKISLQEEKITCPYSKTSLE